MWGKVTTRNGSGCGGGYEALRPARAGEAVVGAESGRAAEWGQICDH